MQKLSEKELSTIDYRRNKFKTIRLFNHQLHFKKILQKYDSNFKVRILNLM